MSKQLPVPPKRALPSKEATLFKDLLALYETRQLKKGLKTADQILKKFPEHGETVCMRGLVLTHMGKREEGLELVKKGMRLDLTSHICWHVFGLIQKGEKNYEEALKSYTQALRFDKDNLNILRDAAQLQTQLRLFDSLVETRYALLRLRPNLRQNWIALAVAYHLNGNLTEAKKIVDHYQKFLKNLLDYDVEQSEILLYHVRILEELGDFKEALSLLDKKAKERAIVDRTAIMEARARILQRLENDEAKNAWHNLIERNPDCYAYYRGYLSCQIDHDQSAALQMLQPFLSQISNARAPWRLALDIAVGKDFEELVKPYLISSLEKGIPSLFADIKSLYKDESKRQTIASIGEELITQHTEPASKSAEPTTYLWTLYLMAQHHSYLGQHEQALTTLDTALTHTPTLPELHMFKARVLKRSGDPLGAARSMNDARLLDGQDRFLNTKCGKYLLRAGMVDEAESIFGLFTKKDASSPAADLEDMQSLLFLSELADCYHRCGKLNLALKKYMAIQKVFNEYEDDQYDFHGYNLRKFTINVYLNLLRWENQLKSHPVYVRSVLKTVQISVAVHDLPSLADPASQAPRLSDEEKRAKKKAKKAAQKTQDEAKKGMLGSQTSHEDRGLDAPPPKDDDPDGYKLLKSPDILDRAAKLLDPLLTGVQDNIDVWFAFYDVSIRRRKLLQAARALQNAQRLDSSHPDIHFRIVHFKSTISSLPQLPQEPVGSIISEIVNLIIPDTVSPETYNSQYLQRYPSSATSILSVAKVAAQILQAPQGEVEKIAFGALSEGVLLDIQAAQDILAFLRSISSQRFDDFRNACDAKFPLSTVFKAAEEQARYRQQVLVAGIQETPEVDGTSGSAADAEKS
ncbi:NMDA receptor-regulated protein 1 domain containing protein [Amanita muscaria]